MFTTALKIALKPSIPILEIKHDQGKCMLFYYCFDHYRMLTYKISACEVCMIWRKPTEALKNPSPIAESRTGKPATVTLKIQLDCSTVHARTMWASMYVPSHLRCGTDSVFIRFCKSHKYFKDAKAMQTRQIRTPVLRIPPAVTSQAKMKNWLHESQKWVSHMIGQYAHI